MRFGGGGGGGSAGGLNPRQPISIQGRIVRTGENQPVSSGEPRYTGRKGYEQSDIGTQRNPLGVMPGTLPWQVRPFSSTVQSPALEFHPGQHRWGGEGHPYGSWANNPNNPNYGQPRPGVGLFREPRAPMASIGYQGGTAQQPNSIKPGKPEDVQRQALVNRLV